MSNQDVDNLYQTLRMYPRLVDDLISSYTNYKAENSLQNKDYWQRNMARYSSAILSMVFYNCTPSPIDLSDIVYALRTIKDSVNIHTRNIVGDLPINVDEILVKMSVISNPY